MATKYFGQISANKLMQIIKSAIAGKVDKVSGKGLSANDYTTEEKTKLAGIAAGAEVNVQADWGENGTGSDAYIKNKPTKLSQFSNDAGFITDADIPEGAAASTAPPLMDGTAAVGTSNAFARGDHVHPSDTAKVSKSGDTMTGALTVDNYVSGTRFRIPAGTGQLDLMAAQGADSTYFNIGETSGVDVVPVIINGVKTPTSPNHAANKQYVDGKAPFIVTTAETGTGGAYGAASATPAQIKAAVTAGRAVYLKVTTAEPRTIYVPLVDILDDYAMFYSVSLHATRRWTVNADKTVSYLGTGLATEEGVNELIASAISGVYTPKGTIAFASLPTASASNRGWVYNISDAFTTTAAFVEGAGHSYGAGTNVVCVDAGSGTYKWDVLAGTIDLEEMTAAEVQTIWDSL